MDCIIREAQASDMDAVLRLVKELAVFEKEADAVVVTVDDLRRHGFGNDKLFHCFVAEYNGEILGIALVFTRYSTWKGPVVHLEDLIVTESARGMGIGTALLDEVVRYSASLGVKRISWEVLDWNEPAIAFYKEKGAIIMRDWKVVHLDEQGIENYLTNIS